MDSSNAEKAWEAFAEKNIDQFIPAPLVGSLKFSFNSGRASRDAEVAALVGLLAESRARFADSEARRAELEAVIQKAKAHEFSAFGDSDTHRILTAAPSVVLEDRDREVAARTLEDATLEFAEGAWNDAFRAGDVDDDISAVQATDAWFNARAAAIRKGDTA